MYRPVDRRENYVKRAVGLPGQNFKIVDDTIFIDGVAQQLPENAQFNYILALNAPITEDYAHSLGISNSDNNMILDQQAREYFAHQLGVTDKTFLYLVPLTPKMIDQMKADGHFLAAKKYSDMVPDLTKGMMYPEGYGDTWTVSNWGGHNGVMIPKKGMTMKINEPAWQLYKRCIRNYENHPDADFRDGMLYIDGKPSPTYTFKMDYYFMMGDNRDNSLDSRFWGFVPEDHVVGTPIFVLVSFDKERGLFSGGFRSDRIFKDANPDK